MSCPSYFENESAANEKVQLLNKINRNQAVVI